MRTFAIQMVQQEIEDPSLHFTARVPLLAGLVAGSVMTYKLRIPTALWFVDYTRFDFGKVRFLRVRTHGKLYTSTYSTSNGIPTATGTTVRWTRRCSILARAATESRDGQTDPQ